ncbi:RNA polymerase sigma factor [Candidatus Uhrbacteria bacterium]|nr:RNA polymerase sigma factor [Candidatus Uhrbacteria bacterium]
MEQNEFDLISAAQQGSKDAFLALYRQHVDVLYRTLLARIGHKETVEDVVQETFLRAIAALPSFTPRRTASFRAWLFRIAMNLYISQYRKQRRVTTVDPETLSALADNAPGGAGLGFAGDFDTVHVRREIEKLEEKEQEIITLRYFSELSYEEIASALGMSVSAVGVRLHRALKRLKGKLGD